MQQWNVSQPMNFNVNMKLPSLADVYGAFLIVVELNGSI